MLVALEAARKDCDNIGPISWVAMALQQSMFERPQESQSTILQVEKRRKKRIVCSDWTASMQDMQVLDSSEPSDCCLQDDTEIEQQKQN